MVGPARLARFFSCKSEAAAGVECEHERIADTAGDWCFRSQQIQQSGDAAGQVVLGDHLSLAGRSLDDIALNCIRVAQPCDNQLGGVVVVFYRAYLAHHQGGRTETEGAARLSDGRPIRATGVLALGVASSNDIATFVPRNSPAQ